MFLNPSLTVDHPDYVSTVERVARQLEALPEVARVATYYDTDDPSMVSDDRRAIRGSSKSSQATPPGKWKSS